jgi:serine-type D-Ala-D-Ala carboxypeptidase/endopeptidase (penicillin-binding protein 4)
MGYVKNSVRYRRRSRRYRGGKRRALAVVIFFALAFAIAWVFFRSHGTQTNVAEVRSVTTSAPAIARATPASSPKPKKTAAPWTQPEVAELHAALNDAFAPAIDGADRWSLAVISADGRVIYANRADGSATPASVQKLVVADTALNELGAAYRYHTIFAARQAVNESGALDSDLWLVGSGDPSLSEQDVRNGIGVLSKLGLRRVDGSVAVDATALRGPEWNPHWDPDDQGMDYAAPTSAISLDGDEVLAHQIVDGAEQSFWTPIRGVPQYVATLLQHLLTHSGIATDGKPLVLPAPLDSVVLWDHRSAPLAALEAHMLYVSDNHYAEQLLRTLGGEIVGNASDAGGLQAEQRFLSERGIPTPGLHLFDGSGLSGDDRIAAITLATLLSDADRRDGDASIYLLLPQGGRQGTLKYYDFTTALGRVRAKSGHITGVSSLAGYVNTMNHGRVVFAFLINGSPGDPDSAIVRAVNRLATF